MKTQISPAVAIVVIVVVVAAVVGVGRSCDGVGPKRAGSSGRAGSC